MAKKKKKRKTPLKRADTQEQVVAQLRRYTRLVDATDMRVDDLISLVSQTRKRNKQYRKRLRYYTKRLEEQAGEAAKALRSIQVTK